MFYLVDTNVLLCFADKENLLHPVVRATLKNLWRDEQNLVVTSQNYIEFWNVATRPAERNGLGLSPRRTNNLLRLFDRLFGFLPDTPEIHREWRRLVNEYQVSGVQVHDARLVATMRVHGVSHILTFNHKDFSRYSPEGIVAIQPSDALPIRRASEQTELYLSDDVFQRAMEYVLEKNKELYQRLA